MGLDTTHGCWHGPYSSFNRWRSAIARAAEYPPLHSMVGYRDGGIPWDPYLSDPLTRLLHHSDCDGRIIAADCGPIADRLQQLLDSSSIVSADRDGSEAERSREQEYLWKQTERFIAGLREAAADDEDVEFH